MRTLALLGALAAPASAGDEIALIVPNFTSWYIDADASGTLDTATQWGLPGDQFLAGEPMATYRDGRGELIACRPGITLLDWYVKENDLGPGYSGRSVGRSFGDKSGRPVLMDLDGNGSQEAVVYEQPYPQAPSLTYIRIDRDGDLRWNRNVDTAYTWPIAIGPDDHILAGRLGPTVPHDEIAIWRDATGNWEMYTTLNAFPTLSVFATVQFGLPGDLPILGDLNDDGVDDLAVFRPSNNMLYINYFEVGDINAGYGPGGDVDSLVDYHAQIDSTNTALGQPGAVWNYGAVAFDYAPEATWSTVGQGLAGSNGVPSLTGSGALHAGLPVEITLSSARPDTTGFLIVGSQQLNQPFLGGLLVPSINSVIPMTTDSTGVTTLSGTWPAGLTGPVAVFLQAWIPDSAGPQGFAATNGLTVSRP